jgi:hypothetical protein
MIKSINERETNKIEIDLTGPDGNAFALLGYAKNFSKDLGYDYGKVSSEMTSGDYENLLNVFDKYFGHFVILYR